jgi:hypothetical protein
MTTDKLMRSFASGPPAEAPMTMIEERAIRTYGSFSHVIRRPASSGLGKQIANDIHGHQRTYRELQPGVIDDCPDNLALVGTNKFL